VTRAGDKVTIEFAVDRETDVAVFIEDGAGKVIRHLVAGVLGKTLRLAQAGPGPVRGVDGKADYGKPALGNGFKVRVALGLGARYDRILISDPTEPGNITSLVAAADGTLYVLHGTGGSMSGSEAGGGGTIRAYDREGKYLRTVLPLPLQPVDEQVKSLGVIELNGRPQPVNSLVFAGLYPRDGTPRRPAWASRPTA